MLGVTIMTKGGKGGKDTRGNICPKCGTAVEPSKTWQLVSPLPDSQGRITITVMGSYECPTCGYRWRGVVTKMKVGEDVEIEGAKKSVKLSKETSKPSRTAHVIELDLEELESEEE